MEKSWNRELFKMKWHTLHDSDGHEDIAWNLWSRILRFGGGQICLKNIETIANRLKLKQNGSEEHTFPRDRWIDYWLIFHSYDDFRKMMKRRTSCKRWLWSEQGCESGSTGFIITNIHPTQYHHDHYEYPTYTISWWISIIYTWWLLEELVRLWPWCW